MEQPQIPLANLPPEQWHRLVGSRVVGIANQGAHAAAKWGVNGLTKSAALVSAAGIRINAICPGPSSTPP